MSFKSIRIYDFKLLDRQIDFNSLVENAIESLIEFSQKHTIEGYVGATLDLIYPDTLQREHLETLSELVKGDVHMLIRFSPANASGLAPEKYSLYEHRYAKLHDYKPWNDK